jgi:oligopeptide/dipeptide ABC transporter ATP-binding protein
MKLQRDLGLSYLFISHDLSVVHHVSDWIAVMYLGRIVEWGQAEAIYAAPGHPYTQALLSGVLQADPTSKRVPIPLASTETADPLHVPPGCRFSNRCPHAMDVCRVVDPANVPHAEGWVACHLYSAGTGSPALREAVIHA